MYVITDTMTNETITLNVVEYNEVILAVQRRRELFEGIEECNKQPLTTAERYRSLFNKLSNF